MFKEINAREIDGNLIKMIAPLKLEKSRISGAFFLSEYQFYF